MEAHVHLALNMTSLYCYHRDVYMVTGSDRNLILNKMQVYILGTGLHTLPYNMIYEFLVLICI